MGPSVEVPSLVRIENERWVFERIDEETLRSLSHQLVVQGESSSTVIGVTENFSTAVEVAKCMAEYDQRVILIRPL
ncbi:MAG: hypothetical protein ISP85_04450 [Candidatus Poseidonia sp.]|nr:hypothetical protein [Poseidonia sp.]MBL6807069.1 hypothetical protein [Poseidonia sp.]MBL6886518.1 hypothetical protein [Poseidonia sp.]MBL6893208.1 hypothetical protein [Poseidonia sp.]